MEYKVKDSILQSYIHNRSSYKSTPAIRYSISSGVKHLKYFYDKLCVLINKCMIYHT
jgi:hypothetical protein